MSPAPAAKGAVSGRTSTRRHAVRSRSEQARLVAAGLLAGLAIAFALLNLGSVEVDWILDTWDTPLIVVIAVSTLVGAILGFVLARRRYAARSAKTPAGSASALD
jgi:uncharacterized integral membrane protein